MLNVGVDKDGLAFIAPSVAVGSAGAKSGGCGTSCGCDGAAPAFKRRDNEPAYALLQPQASSDATVNQHGKTIRLADDNSPLAGKSMNINGSAAVSTNPDRYKQHGFHFSADNCIGCHACEAACSENTVRPVNSFRM